MSSRALRRHHRNRLKAKRKRLHYWGNGWGEPYGRDWAPDTLGIAVNTPQRCSCWGCGNQRRMEGDTLQERRFTLKIRAGVQAFVEKQPGLSSG